MAVDSPSLVGPGGTPRLWHDDRTSRPIWHCPYRHRHLRSLRPDVGAFATVSNMRNILEQVAVIGVVSIGETAVMLTGGIDLSVGSNVLLSSVVMADLNVNHGWPAAPPSS